MDIHGSVAVGINTPGNRKQPCRQPQATASSRKQPGRQPQATAPSTASIRAGERVGKTHGIG